jgi:hypothetical protein
VIRVTKEIMGDRLLVVVAIEHESCQYRKVIGTGEARTLAIRLNSMADLVDTANAMFEQQEAE